MDKEEIKEIIKKKEEKGIQGIIETHAHYDIKRYDCCRKIELDALFKSGYLSSMIIPSIGLDSHERIQSLSQKYPGKIWGAAGIHPKYAESSYSQDWKKMLDGFANDQQVVAIGEAGLDYSYLKPSDNLTPERIETIKQIQEEIFRYQIELSLKYNKPLILHIRDLVNLDNEMLTLRDSALANSYESEENKCTIVNASEKALQILSEYTYSEKPGLWHCYQGSELVKKYLDLGFFIAVGGAITYPENTVLREHVKQIPSNRLLVETDGPYQSLYGRSGMNSSFYLSEIISEIANLRELSFDCVKDITSANAIYLFDLQK